MPEWICTKCDYNIEDPEAPAGQVQATIMHWNVSDTVGEFSAGLNGSVSVTEQNRVFTLAALEAVPMNVLVDWIHEAMGEEEVTATESAVSARIAEQQAPTTGGFIPVDEE